MIEQLENILQDYLIPITIAFAVAWVVQRLTRLLLGRFLKISDLAPEKMRLRSERQHTLHDILSSTLSFLAYAIAGIYTLGLFLDTTTLIWMIGLFSAAFGIGANRLIGDFLTGISFIFEDSFDVGEKVEINTIEGVVERINFRTTLLRAPTGELYVVPNGEIRILRNFSRGRFSKSDITLKIATTDLAIALPLLEALGAEAVAELPNLLEPWEVINTSGIVGQTTELTLLTQAKFGKAAEMRPRLLKLVQERLADAGVELQG